MRVRDLFRNKSEFPKWHPLPGRMPKRGRWVLLWIEPDGAEPWEGRRVYSAKRHKKKKDSELLIPDLEPLSRDWTIPSLPAYDETKVKIIAWMDEPDCEYRTDGGHGRYDRKKQ